MKDAERDERRAALIAVHGQPAPVAAGLALRVLGRRGDVHPRDVAAFAYRDQAAAGAWMAATLAHQAIPHLGTAQLDDGRVVGVYDLRPVLDLGGVPLTSPHLPDDWTPPRA